MDLDYQVKRRDQCLRNLGYWCSDYTGHSTNCLCL
uniref:Uncharacterized protein n=1 Tax=Rhizophora mucronata TaxID=61149 RepID=A0A2P2N133_RHIMU